MQNRVATEATVTAVTATTVEGQRDCPDCGSVNCRSSFEVSDRDQVHPEFGFPIPAGETVRHNWTQCGDCGFVTVS